MAKIFKYVIKGIKLSWTEFRFMIPRKLWKSYYRSTMMKFKYGNQDECFYNPLNNDEYNQWIVQKENFENNNDIKKDITVVVYSNNNFENKSRIESSLKNQVNSNFNIIYTNEFKDIKSEYVMFVNSDDVLSKYCINEIVASNSDLIYFDEDILIDGKRCCPSFKPSWSPDTLISRNYIGNSYAIKTSICNIDAISNETLYKQLLEVEESSLDIEHIPNVLVHKNSSNTIVDSIGIVKEELKRRNHNADLEIYKDNVLVDYKHNNEKVSIIIPTRDGSDILKVCLDSIYEKSTYNNFEIIVVDNGSQEEETFQLFKQYEKKDNFRVLRLECEFNYSYLNNEAAKICNGEYVVLLNNDTEVITPNWMEKMLGYARLDHIGAVGAKLYFPDYTIQHCGVVLGLYLVAGHGYINYSSNYEDYNYITKVATNFSAVTAACLMVKKSKMFEVNGLNENELKVGSNDVDFCIRLLNAGYYNILNPTVELFHHESKSRGLDNKTYDKYLRCKNEIEYMINTYGELLLNDPFYNKNYSLMRAYHLDKIEGVKMREENIGVFTC